MPVQADVRRLTAPDIRARKGGAPIVSLTAYHAHTARLVDQHCDVILVGDSLGMVMHGMESTLPVTVEMMILQGQAVMRGSRPGFLVERGVPFMGHVGLTPQSILALGSFKAQGRDRADWPAILDDAKAVAEAGAFSVVVEAVAEPPRRAITDAVPIPTIGIGASPACDGQILVL